MQLLSLTWAQKQSNLEESYEQTNDDQTAVILESKREAKPHYGKQTFQGSRKSIAHYALQAKYVGSARLFYSKITEVRI